MADETDSKERDEATGTAGEDLLGRSTGQLLSVTGGVPVVAGGDGAEASDDAPAAQLGVQRFVYAAFMAGAILVAFLLAKLTDAAWRKLAQYKPTLGEPVEEVVYVLAAVAGVLLAFYTWRKQGARTYVEEVASELSKVTWPSKKEVTNSTFVVVMTTLLATTFFALMDQFWRFVTDHVYSL